jgi:hypothetical protein
MSELARWDSFYVIVGSAAGALIGLQFVVLTLVAERPTDGVATGIPTFGSPTIVHFGSVLFLSAIVHVPWQTIRVVAALWGIFGGCGVVYVVIIARRLRRQASYRPEFEDWLCHVALPMLAYAMLAMTSIAARSHLREALFGMGAAALLLLFVGIHNAWDSVSYHVVVHRAAQGEQKTERDAEL